MFRAPAMLMPHESTVAHDKTGMTPHFGSLPPTTKVSPMNPVNPVNSGPVTPAKPRLAKRADSQVPNLFANPPAAETQTHELDDDADEEDHSSSSN